MRKHGREGISIPNEKRDASAGDGLEVVCLYVYTVCIYCMYIQYVCIYCMDVYMYALGSPV